MIEAHNLTKRYGETTAVSDLTFTVKPGIVTGFLGPNGSGKSTTMRLILGLDAPSEGEVNVNGKRRCTRSAPFSRRGRSTPAAPRTTTCLRWRRRTGFHAAASKS